MSYWLAIGFRLLAIGSLVFAPNRQGLGVPIQRSERRSAPLASEQTAESKQPRAVNPEPSAQSPRSASLLDAVPEEVVEVGDVVDLLGGHFRVVVDTVEGRLGGRPFAELVDYVARPRVAVARLADRADVHHELLVFDRVDVLGLFGAEEVSRLGEDARHVRVPLEAAMRHQAEQLVHLLLVVDVFGEDVLVHRVPRRAVHVQPVGIALHAGQAAEEVPPRVDGVAVSRGVLELVAGPEDGPFGPAVKTFRVEQRGLVVVAQQAELAVLDNEVQALAGVRPVADDVAEADDLVDALIANVGEHRLERLEIPVNVADNCPFQGRRALPANSASRPRTARGLGLAQSQPTGLAPIATNLTAANQAAVKSSTFATPQRGVPRRNGKPTSPQLSARDNP